MKGPGYNERAWAIDLIACLQSISHNENRTVGHVGGEWSIASEDGYMFLDVLLFRDRDSSLILQGWELKFPDTPIDDEEFRQNAERKARDLGLDSFILWNVRYARLYAIEGGSFTLRQEWDELSDVRMRAEVPAAGDRWRSLARRILQDVNARFADGSLTGRPFIEAYGSGTITDLVLEHTSLTAAAIREETTRRQALRAEVALWWNRYRQDYEGNDRFRALAQANLLNWMGKILFAHVLRERNDRAGRVTRIKPDMSPGDALDSVFCRITEDCNFWTVFCDAPALREIPPTVWHRLCEFNRLLSEMRLGSVDQSEISGLLESCVRVSARKVRGQYTTPPGLAELLVRLCVDDFNDRLLDPCCGSGTVLRAALNMKLDAGIAHSDAARQICGNDLNLQAAQLATFACVSHQTMNQPLRLFNLDAFCLSPDLQVAFSNPDDGAEIRERLGTFRAVVSNLPFIAQQGRSAYADAIRDVNDWLVSEGRGKLPGKSDISAYLPFALCGLLDPGGRLGIIMPNSCLATEWGDAFYDRLLNWFDLKAVVISGAGRWFTNSDVVTNMLILQRRTEESAANGHTDCVVLRQPVNTLEENGNADLAAALITQGVSRQGVLTLRRYGGETMERLHRTGWTAAAVITDLVWALDIPLVPVRKHFEFFRGQRRGWNDLFYPTGEHGIEPEYLRFALRTPASARRLLANANAQAFCCSHSLEELEALGHDGARNWILSFEFVRNGTNRLISEVLATGSLRWYEMRAQRPAELFVAVNFYKRLFVGRLNPPGMIDQRLVGMSPSGDVDVELAQALMNSTIGLLMLEAIGFPRALGALDLSKNRMERHLHMLDPDGITSAAKTEIKRRFQPLLHRDIVEMSDELERNDRKELDEAVCRAFRLDVGPETAAEAMAALTEIRWT